MEITGDLIKGLAVIWRTEIELNRGGILSKSAVFQFQGCEWHLDCRHNSEDKVLLCLVHEEMEGHRHDVSGFRVDCWAQSQDTETATSPKSRTFSRTQVDPDIPLECLYDKNQHKMEEEIADFCSHGKVAFVVIFSCVVESLKPRIAGKSVQANLAAELESLSYSFTFVKECKIPTDAHLKCGDCLIPVHKSVLIENSEVLMAQFRSKMKEGGNLTVDIPDVELLVLKLFLKFMYSGKVPNMSDDVVPKLYTVCDKYAVLNLKNICRERMVGLLFEDNYHNYLLLADSRDDDDFKKSVISYICKHPEFLRLDSWLKFSEKYARLSNAVYRNYLEKTVDLTGTSSTKK